MSKFEEYEVRCEYVEDPGAAGAPNPADSVVAEMKVTENGKPTFLRCCWSGERGSEYRFAASGKSAFDYLVFRKELDDAGRKLLESSRESFRSLAGAAQSRYAAQYARLREAVIARLKRDGLYDEDAEPEEAEETEPEAGEPAL